MNLLAQMNQIMNRTERGYAKITGKHTNGKLIATTPVFATVLLDGTAEVGKHVYYDRTTGRIIEEAPEVVVREWEV